VFKHVYIVYTVLARILMFLLRRFPDMDIPTSLVDRSILRGHLLTRPLVIQMNESMKIKAKVQ